MMPLSHIVHHNNIWESIHSTNIASISQTGNRTGKMKPVLEDLLIIQTFQVFLGCMVASHYYGGTNCIIEIFQKRQFWGDIDDQVDP